MNWQELMKYAPQYNPSIFGSGSAEEGGNSNNMGQQTVNVPGMGPVSFTFNNGQWIPTQNTGGGNYYLTPGADGSIQSTFKNDPGGSNFFDNAKNLVTNPGFLLAAAPFAAGGIANAMGTTLPGATSVAPGVGNFGAAGGVDFAGGTSAVGGAAGAGSALSGSGITDEMLMTNNLGNGFTNPALADLAAGSSAGGAGVNSGWFEGLDTPGIMPKITANDPFIEQEGNLGRAAGSAAPGFFDSLAKGLGSAGGLLGNILGAGANYLTSQDTADKYIQAAKDLQYAGNPLHDPERKQYQDLLSNLENNPADFWQTNPVAKGQLALAENQFKASSGKMGTGGTQFSDYLNNVTNAAGKTFQDQATLLGGLGGFNMPAQGVNASGELMGKGVQAGAEGYRGLGNLFGNNIMSPQATQQVPQQQTQNPVSNSYSLFSF